ncbi:nuclear transport factor 2 family protein [Roseateles sp. NT4]|uniref:nuclear transport factor 2 family protein n=1 Tax=Roseateles sp. NT4 TaxID=3453715 RepID=UPI003EEE2492
MPTADTTLIALEKKFWQSMVDEDTDTALGMLAEPSLMVSSHGAMQFSHEQYREMAEKGSMVLKSFELSDMQVMHPNEDTAVLTYRVKQEMAPRDGDAKPLAQEMADSSVWMRKDGEWQCVMHTETELEAKKKPVAKKAAKSASH